MSALEICWDCGGDGVDPTDWQSDCLTCNGTGYTNEDDCDQDEEECER